MKPSDMCLYNRYRAVFPKLNNKDNISKQNYLLLQKICAFIKCYFPSTYMFVPDYDT